MLDRERALRPVQLAIHIRGDRRHVEQRPTPVRRACDRHRGEPLGTTTYRWKVDNGIGFTITGNASDLLYPGIWRPSCFHTAQPAQLHDLRHPAPDDGREPPAARQARTSRCSSPTSTRRSRSASRCRRTGRRSSPRLVDPRSASRTFRRPTRTAASRRGSRSPTRGRPRSDAARRQRTSWAARPDGRSPARLRSCSPRRSARSPIGRRAAPASPMRTPERWRLRRSPRRRRAAPR